MESRAVDPIHVLHVDDEPGFADLAATFLERSECRFEVHAATSPEAGLDHLADHDVDCVVSDFDMPRVDGLELLEAVRVDYPDLPFILFTGKGSEELASDAISAGVTDYMQKDSGTEQYEILARRIRNAVERYRAHERAAEAQARAQTILNASPDAILVSVDGEYVYANGAAGALFGSDDGTDLVGHHVSDFVDSGEVDVDEVVDRIQTDHDETVTRTRRRLRTLDGETFPAEVTARRVTWDGHAGIFAIVRDLSEHEEREHRRARYAAAFEEAMDAMVVADDEGRYVDANASACELFGLPRAELLGKRIHDFAPPDYDVDDAWTDFDAEGEDVGTFPLVRPDGERRLVEYAATADIVPGEHLSVMRDVTERTRLEAELRTEQEALKSMYRVTADTESTFEEKVASLLEIGCEYLDLPYGFLTEIDDGTQTIAAAHGDHASLQAGETCPLSEAYCRETITREELVTVQNAVAEGWETDPAYERFGLGCYVGAKVTVDDDLYGTFCFAGTEPRERPFSEAERAFVELMARWVSYERTQQRSTEELRRQNERLAEFASMVSHDLRNPLSVARGFLDLAREEGQAEQFDRVETAHDRMERIIDDLLYLAREGDDIGDLEPVDLRDAVADAWDVVAGETAASLAVDDDLPTIEADPARLAQLLENVLRNAIEHGGPDVTVHVASTPGGFAIEDDGPGIPADVRERIFERGYSTTESTGFGLHIVSDIVAAHGWEIRVSESDTGGARFEISGVEVPVRT